MYTMKEVCNQVGMKYETLKFYCKEGLIPNIKRNENNHRMFDERNIEWLKGLQCLRKCGMSIKDMKQYMNYCLQGISSIDKRKSMLHSTREVLLERLADINDSIAYIDNKQQWYDDVVSGKEEYTSNLINTEC